VEERALAIFVEAVAIEKPSAIDRPISRCPKLPTLKENP
jgi:hypothetical protein